MLPIHILKTIDKPIYGIIIDLNKLFFVKMTHASCSGHIEDPSNLPYVDIEFFFCPHTIQYIQNFIKALKGISGSTLRIRKQKIYHFVFDWDGTERNLSYIWDAVNQINKKFLAIPQPVHDCR